MRTSTTSRTSRTAWEDVEVPNGAGTGTDADTDGGSEPDEQRTAKPAGRGRKRGARGGTTSDTAGAAGGAAMHLSEAAIALILKRILLGDTNAQINQALRQAGHLRGSDEVSRQTFTKYRRDPRAKVERGKLTDGALQAGHVLLSESIVRAVEAARALNARVQLSPGVLYPHKDPKHLKTYAELQLQYYNFLWDKLGSLALVERSLKSVAASVAATEPVEAAPSAPVTPVMPLGSVAAIVDFVSEITPGMTELERLEMQLTIKEQWVKTLLARMNQHKQVLEEPEETTAAVPSPAELSAAELVVTERSVTESLVTETPVDKVLPGSSTAGSSTE